MLEGIVITLGGALLLYTLLGGADFGAGILELFWRRSRSTQRRTLVAKAIGPVWEANHVWLILAIVILFMGFPGAYAAISTTFHLPLTFLLTGIVCRGCAFAFESYDPFPDRSHRLYARVFALSSAWSSFWIGILAGGVMLGLPLQTVNFYEAFVAPWMNLFCLSMGVFVCCLHAFLAAVYLIGESQDPKMKRDFAKTARLANQALLLAGLGVFVCGQQTELHLAARFFRNPVSGGCFALASALLWPLWRTLYHRQAFWARLIAATEGALVLIGWYAIQFPYLIRPLTLAEAAAPDSTLSALALTLAIGFVFVMPAFLYLLKIFKFHPGMTAE